MDDRKPSVSGVDAFAAYLGALPFERGRRGWSALSAEERAAWEAVPAALAEDLRPSPKDVAAAGDDLLRRDFSLLLEAFMDLVAEVPLQTAFSALKARLTMEVILRQEMMKDPRFYSFFAISQSSSSAPVCT